MRKRILTVMIAVLCCLSAVMGVAAENEIHVVINGQKVEFSRAPVMIDNRMLVPIRTVAEAMECQVGWDAQTQSVLISNDRASLRLRIDYDVMWVGPAGEEASVQLDIAPILIEDTTYLPLRKVVEALGGSVVWDDTCSTIFIAYPSLEEGLSVQAVQTGSLGGNHTFYFQNEARFALPDSGSGYCWVCSYAMVLSDVMGRAITPVDVANVNLRYSESGAYCYHAQIVSEFGAKFVPALDSSSPYYNGYDVYFGATYLKLTDEQSAVNALKEALDRNPAGILVRFEAVSPHTLVAIGYEGNTIYFNETIPYGSGYSDTSIYQNIPFSQTFPGGYCGLGLKDLTSIQAIAAQ